MLEFSWASEKNRVVVIKCSKPKHVGWTDICQICSANTYNVDKWKYDEIILPIRQYMVCHKEVGKTIHRLGIEYTVEDSLALSIKDFREQEEMYYSTRDSKPVKYEDIQKLLLGKKFCRVLKFMGAHF